MDDLILCIPANRCNTYKYDQKTGTCWLPREEAERDSIFRQVIPYCAVQRPDGKILSYRRKGNEERLHGYVSIGVGGHIDYPETFMEGMDRELYEEAGVMNSIKTHLGIIELFDTEVDLVHVGIGFLIETDEAEPKEELLEPKWMTLDELSEVEGDMEPWSKKLLWLIKNPF
jgi:predicted NUDIX family phosphoesterase